MACCRHAFLSTVYIACSVMNTRNPLNWNYTENTGIIQSLPQRKLHQSLQILMVLTIGNITIDRTSNLVNNLALFVTIN